MAAAVPDANMRPTQVLTVVDITGVDAAAALGTQARHLATSAKSRYEKFDRALGEGTFGIVYRARDKERGDAVVALKKMPMDVWNEGMMATAVREVTVLKNLASPHLVSLLDVFASYNGNLYLVFELMDCDLKNVMDAVQRLRLPGLPPDLVRYLFWQLLQGLLALHTGMVMHRDLKPQNILVDKNTGLLKIADFGLARTFSVPPREYTHEVVTLWYRPPEILMGQPVYNAAVDVWSAGCILAEMTLGQPLFMGDSEIDQLMKIMYVLGTPTEAEWPGVTALPDYLRPAPRFPRRGLSTFAPSLEPLALDLLAKMLTFDPTKRPTVEACLAHPYFEGVETTEPGNIDEALIAFHLLKIGPLPSTGNSNPLAPVELARMGPMETLPNPRGGPSLPPLPAGCGRDLGLQTGPGGLWGGGMPPGYNPQ